MGRGCLKADSPTHLATILATPAHTTAGPMPIIPCDWDTDTAYAPAAHQLTAIQQVKALACQPLKAHDSFSRQPHEWNTGLELSSEVILPVDQMLVQTPCLQLETQPVNMTATIVSLQSSPPSVNDKQTQASSKLVTPNSSLPPGDAS